MILQWTRVRFGMAAVILAAVFPPCQAGAAQDAAAQPATVIPPSAKEVTQTKGGVLLTIPVAETVRVKPCSAADFIVTLEDFAGKQVRLLLDGRIEASGFGGNTNVMVVKVNGKDILGRHLINKPLNFMMREGSELLWTGRDGACFRLMYAHDYSDRIRTDEDLAYGLANPIDDPYHFVFDITPLVQEGENAIRLSHPSAYDFNLHFRNVGVEVGSPRPSLNKPKVIPPAPTGPLPIFMPKGSREMAKEIEVSQFGGIRLRSAGRTFRTQTRSSLPGGTWREAANEEEEERWTTLGRDTAHTVTWVTPQYTLQRDIILKRDHISVKDTLYNPTDELVGIKLDHVLHLPERAQNVILGGVLEGGLRERRLSAHPTAFAQFEDVIVGLVAEDDILRIHGYLVKGEGEKSVSLAERELGIAPGTSHTLEWSVYAIADGDYWDMINAIRRNWGANYTWRGPLRFHGSASQHEWRNSNLTEEFLRAWLKENPNKWLMTYNATSLNVSHAAATLENPFCFHGTAILNQPEARWWLDNTKHIIGLVRKVDPSIYVFAYIHKNLCTEVGYQNKYVDSRAVDTEGNWAKAVYKPRPGLFVPTVENSYGRELRKVYQHLVDELDANVYVDEISFGGAPGYGVYEQWDGCTVQMDSATHAVTRKVSQINLLVQPWLEELMQYLKARGKIMMGNGYIISRTMLNWRIHCFLEEGMGYKALRGMHLGTPLGWNGYYVSRPKKGFDHMHQCLDYAALALTRSGPWNDQTFPLTPVELREGMIIGTERIVTNRSGRFSWGDQSRARVYVYNSDGLVTDPDVKELGIDGVTYTEIRMPGDHLAVLVRTK